MNFEQLWNALPSPAFLINEVNEISAANHAAEGFLNVSAKSLLGHRCIEKVSVAAPLEPSFQRVRNSHSPVFINDVEVGRDLTQCGLQIAPVSNEDSHVLLLINPSMGAAGASHKPPSETAAKSAIGMAEMLAHEVKNPLAGITGAAQLLAMNLSPEDLEMTDLIVSESKRIVALLDQVEQFGNLSPANRVAVNIYDVIDRAQKSAQVGFAAHMRFVQEYDPSLPETWGDADQLIQVMANLLKNASQAAQNTGGEIKIRTSFDNGLRRRRADGTDAPLPIRIEIIDNGPGLPPDIIDDVFDPFVSGRENGTGLGLALVSKIISEHEGLISVDSKPGRTIFRISLPTAPKPTTKNGAK